MRPFLHHLLVASLLCCASILTAQETESLVTRDGKEYQGVKLEKVEGLLVSFSHSGGLASIDVRNLPEEFRRKHNLLPTLLEKKENYREAVRNWLEGFEKLNAQYDGALARLEQEMTAAGDLDSVLEVKTERTTFRTTPQPNEPKNARLRDLVGKYKSAKARWMSENNSELVRITTAYVTDLAALKTRLTSEGKTGEADETAEEWQKLEGVQDDAVAIQATLGIGPGRADVAEAAASAHPDGILKEKKAGDLAMVKAGKDIQFTELEPEQTRKIVEVQADGFSWAALNKDGRLFSSELTNGEIPEDHKEVTFFRVGSGMVVAFHPDGTFSKYGDPINPEDAPPDDLRFVSDFALARGNGIALLNDGKVRVWGKVFGTNESKRQAVEDALIDIRFVSASEKILWAVTTSGEIYISNNGSPPKLLAQHDEITHFRGGKISYLVLLEDKSLKGGPVYDDGRDPTIFVPEGRRSGIDIRLDYWGYALQFENGTWFTWGGGPESGPIHDLAKTFGVLIDFEISASPERVVIMAIR